MKSFVVDASVAIQWFVPESQSIQANKIMDLADKLFAPDLIVAEVGNVLWKKHRAGELTADETLMVVSAFKKVPLELHPSSEIVEIAFSLAAATGRTVYDCLYVALATVLSAPLITADRKLYNALHHGKYSQHVLNLDEI